jgi:hypothetical protein
MKHQGLDLAGIIITYVFSVSIVAAMILSWVSWGWLEGYEIVLLVVGLITLVLVSLYHANIVKNRIIVGIFATLISVLGGVFILVSKTEPSNSIDNFPSNKNTLSASDRLRQLKQLFDEGIISEDAYFKKKEEIVKEL